MHDGWKMRTDRQEAITFENWYQLTVNYGQLDLIVFQAMRVRVTWQWVTWQ